MVNAKVRGSVAVWTRARVSHARSAVQPPRAFLGNAQVRFTGPSWVSRQTVHRPNPRRMANCPHLIVEQQVGTAVTMTRLCAQSCRLPK